MKRIIVCALTSRDAARVERLIRSVEQQNLPHNLEWRGVVVCNTLNESYPDEALEVANKYHWDFIRTESNGRPGKGKNSALEQFSLAYIDYDYMLLMDGDDFLYPCAFQQIERLLRGHPDVVGLQTNDIVDKIVYEGMSKIELAPNRYLYSWFDQQNNLYAMPQYWHKVDRSLPLGQHSTPDRIILFSHDASAILRCSEELPVYEDYVLSMHAQYRFLMGHLTYINTSATTIYVYDKTMEVSTCKEFDATVGDWSLPTDLFNSEITPLVHVLKDFHASEVPFVTLPKPQYFTLDYRVDFLKTNML